MIGDIQILTGLPATTVRVGYTLMIMGLLVAESGYCAIEQTS